MGGGVGCGVGGVVVVGMIGGGRMVVGRMLGWLWVDLEVRGMVSA